MTTVWWLITAWQSHLLSDCRFWKQTNNYLLSWLFVWLKWFIGNINGLMKLFFLDKFVCTHSTSEVVNPFPNVTDCMTQIIDSDRTEGTREKSVNWCQDGARPQKYRRRTINSTKQIKSLLDTNILFDNECVSLSEIRDFNFKWIKLGQKDKRIEKSSLAHENNPCDFTQCGAAAP